jgi:2-polyprenyl-6-methoxyphenol hydroxylase-like FAD-dependent oxidoreductase
LQEAGAGIWLGGNAMNALEALGVGAIIKQKSNRLSKVFIKTQSGKVLQTVDCDILEKKYGNATYGIHRATLQLTLAAHIKQTINTGHRLSSIRYVNDKVEAVFENGNVAIGDIIVGADGIRSSVREQYVTKSNYRYSGQTCWRAIIDTQLPPDEYSVGAEVWGNKGGLRASYTQLGGNQVYFWTTMKMAAGVKVNNADALSLIQKELSPFSGYMQQIIRMIQPERLIHSDLFDMQPIKKWYHNRIVLLGDAAHATTPNLGQGASQAIEDAWVLADSLSKYDYANAFVYYQQKRIQRATKVVDTSYRLAQLTNLGGPIFSTIKSALLTLTPDTLARKQFDFLYNVTFED